LTSSTGRSIRYDQNDTFQVLLPLPVGGNLQNSPSVKLIVFKEMKKEKTSKFSSLKGKSISEESFNQKLNDFLLNFREFHNQGVDDLD